VARQQVVQIQCDRCKRVSLVPEGPQKVAPDFEAALAGKRLVYADLCEHCKKALENLWEDLSVWDRQVKQTLLAGPTVQDNQAAPLQTAPDFTPPKPHSVAGAKRS
jgi:hypothetical protein